MDLARDLKIPFIRYQIDLRYPVNKTLSEVKEVIGYFRKTSRIRQRTWPEASTYPALLRTLDALSVGASKTEIGKIIFNTRDLTRTATRIKQAKNVQEIITAYQRLKSDK